MTCEVAVDLIVDSLLDALDERQARALAGHLESCGACAAESRSLTALWNEMATLPAMAPPPPEAARAEADKGGWPAPRPRSATPSRGFLPVAAAIALLFLGGIGGYLARGSGVATTEPLASGATYLLLVRGHEPDARMPHEALVDEYRRWALELAEDGRLVAAGKLTDEPGRWIAGPETGEARARSDISGYFLIRAADYEQAVEVATTSPHVRYGGVFEIRRVESGE